MLSDKEITALCKVQGWHVQEEELTRFVKAVGIMIIIRDEELNVIGHSGGHEANGRTPLQQAYKRAVENFNNVVPVMVDEDFGGFGHFENLKR